MNKLKNYYAYSPSTDITNSNKNDLNSTQSVSTVNIPYDLANHTLMTYFNPR